MGWRSGAFATLVALFAVPVSIGNRSSTAIAHDAANVRHHAISLIGKPKEPAGYKHFSWVNPDAPRGGTVRLHGRRTFDSFNHLTVKGNPIDPETLALLHASLMSQSPDEAATEYGYVAEWVRFPADFSSATFKLRAGARFNDGRPIGIDDIAFSLAEVKRTHPLFAQYYKNVVGVEATGDREVTFRFDIKGNRELPHIIGQLPILAKHWWTGSAPDGTPRDLAKTTLEPFVGSGPYRIGSFEVGRFVALERVKDWWAANLPVMRGQYNFDEVRYLYFSDPTAAFVAFKGGEIDFWHELSASAWAKEFEFDGVRRGLVARDRLKIDRVARMQGFVFNIRRKPFEDRRVRQAFELAFNFEWANKTIMHNAYRRVTSYFEGSELMAKGLPEGRERELLEAVKDGLPEEVFKEPFKVTTYTRPEDERAHLAAASRLLTEAGWTFRHGPATGKPVLRNAAGEKLSIEFLLYSRSFERVVMPYISKLELLGIEASVRTVDPAQYQKRLNTFDFDIVISGYAQSLSPGNEQREFWGSVAAGREGSRNLSGIRNPAIDKLIEALVVAKDRAELVAASRALDRALLWNYYLVTQWYDDHDNVASWRMFGRPERLPSRAVSFLRVWWHDAAAHKRLQEARSR